MSLGVTAIVIGTEKLARELQKKGNDIVKETEIAIKKSALLVEGDTKKSMRGGGSPHVPSRPGEPPRVDTNLLRASITHQFIRGPKGNIVDAKVGVRSGDDPDKYNYGIYLEFGTSNIQKRPFLLPALNKNAKAIRRFIERGVRTAIK